MQPIMIVVIVGLLGGVAVAFQVPLAGIITQRLGMLESAFIVHLGGAVTAFIPLAFLAGGRLGEWRGVPAWAYLSGFIGHHSDQRGHLRDPAHRRRPCPDPACGWAGGGWGGAGPIAPAGPGPYAR